MVSWNRRVLEGCSVMANWGQYKVKIDDKGRVSLPAPFREDFLADEGGFLVWRVDHIGLMNESTWNKYFRRLEDDEDLSPDDLQVLASWATPFKLDHQGRLVVNQLLRERAGLENEVVLVGSKNYISVYEPGAWEQLEASRTMDSDAVLSRKVKNTWVR